MEFVKKLVKNNMRQYTMLIALILISLLFQYLTGGVLLVPMNLTNLVLQNAYVLIIAMGMMMCLIAGGNIDLSVGSVAAFVGAIAGTLIINNHVNVAVAIAIAITVGLLIGIWQGFWIAYLRLPGFIVTLAGTLLFRGLTLWMLNGQTLAPFPDSFVQISNGFIPDFFGKGATNITAIAAGIIISVLYIFLTIRKRKSSIKNKVNVLPFAFFIAQIVVIVAVIMIAAYCLAAYKGLPIIFILIGVLAVVYTFIISKTVPGRYLYAFGGNEKAAKLSGINTNKVLFLVYVNVAVLASVAGIAFASRLNAASPQTGNGFDMDSIAACFIGGASMYGGVGTISGAIIGALFMGVLNNGMSILGVGTDVQQIVKGMVLLFAVAFDLFSKSRSKAA